MPQTERPNVVLIVLDDLGFAQLGCFGFARYYGFLHGDANHWTPNLARDNQFVDPPYGPDEGYHLTEDLASTAIANVVAQQEAAPGKPFFLYFALGAVHAPHHVADEW